MERQSRFSLEKVKAYSFLLKSKGRESVLRHFEKKGEAVDFDPREISVSLASWLYYQLKKEDLDTRRIRSLVEKDKRRGEFVVGYDITVSDDLTSFPDDENRYHAALALIDAHWPEMAELIRGAGLRVSYIPATEDFESSSHPTRFTQIYYNARRTRAIDWAEILVHEMSHQYVFVATADPKAKTYPWSTSVYSSIKDAQRPLIGLYHSAYAQASMLELATRIVSETHADEATRDGAREILRRYQQGYLHDLQTLDQYGLLEYSPEAILHLGEARERIKECA